MRHLLLILTVFLSATVVYGQVACLKIGGGGNDNAFSIVQSYDGGFVLVGSTQSFGSGDWDMYIVKISSIGTLQWNFAIGDSSTDVAYSLIQTNDSGFAIVGFSYSFDTISSIYIAKTNSVGALQWTRTIKGYCGAYSIIQSNDGGYVVAGNTAYGAGGGDMYVVKLDMSGILEWARTIGGTSNENGNSIIQDNDGNFIVAGSTQSFGQNGEVYVVKLNNTGNLIWTRTIGGSGLDNGNAITLASDGNYVIVGSTYSFGAGASDVYVIKLDTSGNLQWTKTIGGTSNDYGYSVSNCYDKGFIVSGSVRINSNGIMDAFYEIKLDSTGLLQWAHSFGDAGNFWDNKVVQTTDGGFAVGGSGYGVNMDFIFMKLDSNGYGCCFVSNVGVVGSGGFIGTGGIINSIFPTTGSGGTAISGGNLTTVCNNLSISENSTNEKNYLFPNPFSTLTTLQTANPLYNAILTVDNVFGQTVKQIKNISGRTVVLYRDNLPSGLYFIRLIQDNKIIETNKFIITD